VATETIQAPFTDKQVEALNSFQLRPDVHPFTCGNDQHQSGGAVRLVATNNGWVCSDEQCDYTQDWAHSFMTA
jgi:hypothetical protein